MILADTSAWVEYLRGTGSEVHVELRGRLTAGELAVCDPVRMEVLSGGRDDLHVARLHRLLDLPADLGIRSGDFDLAAILYRTCRRRGVTVRRLLDCLIAAVAIREDVPVLHADRDFAAIARHSPLRLAI